MKSIELTLEWVLNELPISFYADGNGNVSLKTDNVTDAKRIRLALDTSCIPYKENDYGDVETIFFGFEFRIEDIKDNCPAFYRNMKEMDTRNNLINKY